MKNAVDDRPEYEIANLRDDDETAFAVAGAEAQYFLEMQERQQRVAQPQYRRVLDPFDAMLAGAAGAHEFEHRQLGNGEPPPPRLDDQCGNDRQRERNLDRK